MCALAEALKGDYDRIPTSAIELYTHYEQLAQGLQQFMAGGRKFAVEFLDRGDIVALTQEVAVASGIPYALEADKEEAEKILG